LWRTRALTRALRVREEGEELGDVVAALHGRYRIHAGEETLADLSLRRSVPPPRVVSTEAGPAAQPQEGAPRARRDEHEHSPGPWEQLRLGGKWLRGRWAALRARLR